MLGWLCKMFDHSWKTDSAGASGGVFGAIVVNYRTCRRCGKTEHELSTFYDIKERMAKR